MNSTKQVAQGHRFAIKLQNWLSQYGTAVLLVSIITIGAGLRLYGLATQSLWNDELSSWRRSNVDTLSQIFPELPPEHPPGFQIFLYFWTHFVGDSETLLRLPSVIAGTLTIYAMFLLGRKLYSEKEGLIAASLTAVLWTPLYYSQEARANIMLLLVAVLSTYWLLDIGQALKTGGKLVVTAVIGYVVTAALASYLHYFGLFFIGLQAAFIGLYFVPKFNTWPKLILIYSLILLAYSPWLIQAITALTTGGPAWIQPPKSDAFIKFLRFLFNNSKELTNLVLSLWVFLGITIFWRIKQKPLQVRHILFSADGLLIIWFLVPFVLIYVKSIISSPVLNNRNLIILLPAAYLLLARAITQLPFRRLMTPLMTILILGLFAQQLFFEKKYYQKPTKEQFREAVAFVDQHQNKYPDNQVVGWAWFKAYLDYYFIHFDSSQRVDLLAGQKKDIKAARNFLQTSSPSYIWFIAAHRKPDRAFVAFLHSEFDLILHESFINTDVWLFAYD